MENNDSNKMIDWTKDQYITMIPANTLKEGDTIEIKSKQTNMENNNIKQEEKEQQLREAAERYLKFLGLDRTVNFTFDSVIEFAKSEAAKDYHQQTEQSQEFLEDVKLLHFIDWFGSWLTDKNINDYGINDIQEAYRKQHPFKQTESVNLDELRNEFYELSKKGFFQIDEDLSLPTHFGDIFDWFVKHLQSQQQKQSDAVEFSEYMSGLCLSNYKSGGNWYLNDGKIATTGQLYSQFLTSKTK